MERNLVNQFDLSILGTFKITLYVMFTAHPLRILLAHIGNSLKALSAILRKICLTRKLLLYFLMKSIFFNKNKKYEKKTFQYKILI